MNEFEEVVRLSDIVSRLLSENNKNRKLGELSNELSDYIFSIKQGIDSKEISYEKLRREINKYINDVEDVKPGSVAQFLLGCTKGEENCPLRKEEVEDVAFIYDTDEGKLKTLSHGSIPLTDNSCAVIYITGEPEEIDVESLRILEGNGFKKIKIKYRQLLSTTYKTKDVENLKRYIFTIPEKSNIGRMLAFLSFMAFIVFFILTKVSKPNV